MNSENKAAVAVACVWAFLVAGILIWPGAFPLQNVFELVARSDEGVVAGRYPFDPSQVHATLRAISVLCLTLGALALLAWFFRKRVFTPSHLFWVFRWSITAGSCWTLYLCLKKHGFENSLFPLERILHQPETLPIVGRRLLMVWLAKGVQAVFPFVSDKHAYSLSVGVAIFLATYSTGRWSARLFGEQWSSVAQILLVAIVSPTFTYFTFYDVAMVFFFTLALLFLHERRYWLYVLTAAVGTFNHENILLLIPLAGFLLWNRESVPRALGFPAAALALHMAGRAALIALLPSDHSFDWHFYSNLYDVYTVRSLLRSGATLFPWWICGACGFFVAEDFLRRATLLLPLLIGVTYLFGQFQEARQFVAFTPVLIGLIVSFLKNTLSAADFGGRATKELVPESEPH